MTQYFGKYRGKVESSLDPLNIGRIQVSVPAVLGEGRLSWAMPCAASGQPRGGHLCGPQEGQQCVGRI